MARMALYGQYLTHTYTPSFLSELADACTYVWLFIKGGFLASL